MLRRKAVQQYSLGQQDYREDEISSGIRNDEVDGVYNRSSRLQLFTQLGQFEFLKRCRMMLVREPIADVAY